MTITIPGIGSLTPGDHFSTTAPQKVSFLDRDLTFAADLKHVSGELDAATAQAIADFCTLDCERFTALTQPAVYAYYQRTYNALAQDDAEYLPIIKDPQDVWNHVAFGDEPLVTLRYPDKRWQIAWECECEWEEEPGLAIALLGLDSEPLASDCGSIF